MTIAAPEGDPAEVPPDRTYRLRIATARAPVSVTIGRESGASPEEANWHVDPAGFVIVEGVQQPALVSLAWPR